MKEEIQKQIAGALEELFGAVSKLQAAYPGKPFTLDGRLVGDIGEVVASLHYRIKLNEGLTRHHDAVADDGRNVQIKTTFSTNLTFPVGHVPDYYLGIKLNRDGTFEEIYNGPGHLIKDELKKRAPTSTGLHGNIMRQLKRINLSIPDDQRIPRS